MRKFGTDAPDFLAFQLEGEDAVYKLPLASSMPAETLIALTEAEERGETAAVRKQLEVLATYMGAEAVASLTMSDLRNIFAAWLEESKARGASQGE